MKDINIENQVYIKKIAESAKNGTLVYFIGSGFSKSVNKNNKTWAGLIDEMKKELHTKETDYLKVAQMYFDNFGHVALKNRLKKNVYSNIENKNVIDRLFSTKPLMLFTTNWDDILENYINSEHLISWRTVAKDRDVIELRQNNRLLVKVHGDFKNNNFVFTEDSYINYDKNFKLIRNLIINILATRTIVFLGYSFSDPDIKQIIKFFDEEEVKQLDMYYVNTSDHYQTNRFERKYLSKYGLKVIDFENCENRLEKYFKIFDEAYRSINSVIENIENDNKYYSNSDYIYINHIYDIFEQSKINVEPLYYDSLILYFFSLLEDNEEYKLFLKEIIDNSKKESDNETETVYILKKDCIYYEYFSKYKARCLCFENENEKQIKIIVCDNQCEDLFDFVSFRDKMNKFFEFAYAENYNNPEVEYINMNAKEIFSKISNRLADYANVENEKFDGMKFKNEIDNIMSIVNYTDKSHINKIEKLIHLTDVSYLYMKVNEKIYKDFPKENIKYVLKFSKFDDIRAFAAKIYSIVLFSKNFNYPIERYYEFGNTIKKYIELYFNYIKRDRKIIFDQFAIYLMVAYLQHKDITMFLNKKEIQCTDKDIEWVANSIDKCKNLISNDTLKDHFAGLETYSSFLLNLIYVASFINSQTLFKNAMNSFQRLLSGPAIDANYIKVCNHYFYYQYKKYKRKCDENDVNNLIDLLISKLICEDNFESMQAESKEILKNGLYSFFNIVQQSGWQYHNKFLVEKLIDKISKSLKSTKTNSYIIYLATRYFLLQIYYISSKELKNIIKEFYLEFIKFVWERKDIDLHDIDIYIALSAEFYDKIINFNEIYDVITKYKKLSSIFYDIKDALTIYKELKWSKLGKSDQASYKKCVAKIDEFIREFEVHMSKFR